jgi:hypothetical protein
MAIGALLRQRPDDAIAVNHVSARKPGGIFLIARRFPFFGNFHG